MATTRDDALAEDGSTARMSRGSRHSRAIGSSRQVWSLALGYHPNRCIGFGGIVHGCLGRAYRDVHHTIGQLGCSAGQEGDGLGESPHGISIITTLPRPRHGDCLLFFDSFDDTRSHMFFFL